MFSRLGQSRDRVYKVFGSAPVKTVLLVALLSLRHWQHENSITFDA